MAGGLRDSRGPRDAARWCLDRERRRLVRPRGPGFWLRAFQRKGRVAPQSAHLFSQPEFQILRYRRAGFYTMPPTPADLARAYPWALRVLQFEDDGGYPGRFESPEPPWWPVRSEWGDAPWLTEPDLVEWRLGGAPYPLMILRGQHGPRLQSHVGGGAVMNWRPSRRVPNRELSGIVLRNAGREMGA